MPNAECGMPECGMRNANAECGMPNAECGMPECRNAGMPECSVFILILKIANRNASGIPFFGDPGFFPEMKYGTNQILL